MKEKKLNIGGNPVRCDCGKVIAVERDGMIYIMCKSCKRQIPIAKSQEPK